MSSSSGAILGRVGAQRPTHLLTPDGDFDFSDGDLAVELAERLGLVLLEWQRWLVRWILAVDGEGRPACNTVIILVPRQNGKGAILEAVELFWLVVAGVPHVIHTAHEADTAAGHQERLDELTAEPEIELPALKSYKANGKERIRNLDDRLVLQFRTRTKATKRGASPQRIVLDECQELQDAHLAALVPSLAAQSMDPDRMPQLIFTGSAPLEHSVYMHGLLKRVQAKPAPGRTLLAMWAVDPDADPADVDLWYRTNPSLGILISEQWVRDTEYLTMSREDFLAERLGLPKGGTTAGQVIDVDRWRQLERFEKPVEGTVRLALDSPDTTVSATFGMAGRLESGQEHVQVRWHVPTEELGDVVRMAKSLVAEHGGPLVIVRGSPAMAWHGELVAAGVEVDVMSTDEFGQACGLMRAKVAEGVLSQRFSPELSQAVAGLVTHRRGDVEVFVRGVSGSPLVAVTAALQRVAQPPSPVYEGPLVAFR